MTDWFPLHTQALPRSTPAEGTPITLVERARMSGETERARSCLDATGHRGAGAGHRTHLRELRYHLAELGDMRGGLRVRARVPLSFAEAARDRAFGWQDLAGLERRAGAAPGGLGGADRVAGP
ncbi:hypothetical protein GCM10020229_15570 [Kitasatospora albolonga]